MFFTEYLNLKKNGSKIKKLDPITLNIVYSFYNISYKFKRFFLFVNF